MSNKAADAYVPSLPTWDDNTPFIKVRSGLIIPSSTRDVKYLLNSFSIITLIGNDNDETISCTLASGRLPSSNKDLYLFRKYSLPFTFCFCLLPFSVTSISISPFKNPNNKKLPPFSFQYLESDLFLEWYSILDSSDRAVNAKFLIIEGLSILGTFIYVCTVASEYIGLATTTSFVV